MCQESQDFQEILADQESPYHQVDLLVPDFQVSQKIQEFLDHLNFQCLQVSQLHQLGQQILANQTAQFHQVHLCHLEDQYLQQALINLLVPKVLVVQVVLQYLEYLYHRALLCPQPARGLL